MPSKDDPLQSFTFVVDANGLTGYFTSVDGLGSEHEVVEHKGIVDGKEVTRKLAGRVKWGDVTLKRGLTDDKAIWEWRQMVLDGKLDKARKNCTITMLNREYKPAVVWNLVNAWPSKVSALSISSDSNDFLVEEMVLVHEGISRDEKTVPYKRL